MTWSRYDHIESETGRAPEELMERLRARCKDAGLAPPREDLSKRDVVDALSALQERGWVGATKRLKKGH